MRIARQSPARQPCLRAFGATHIKIALDRAKLFDLLYGGNLAGLFLAQHDIGKQTTLSVTHAEPDGFTKLFRRHQAQRTMPFGLGSARRAGLQGTKRQQSFVNKFLMCGIIVAFTHHPAFGRALERQRDGTRHAPSVHNFQGLRRVNLTGKIRQQNFPLRHGIDRTVGKNSDDAQQEKHRGKHR